MINASKKSSHRNFKIALWDTDSSQNNSYHVVGNYCLNLERGRSPKFENLESQNLKTQNPKTQRQIRVSDKPIVHGQTNLQPSKLGKPNSFPVSNSIVNKIVTNEDELINEKKLYLAILERGIRDYLSANKKYFESAKEWIDSNSSDYPFSFVNICAALGFDKNRLRKKLVELRAVARKNNRNSREIYRILNDLEVAS